MMSEWRRIPTRTSVQVPVRALSSDVYRIHADLIIIINTEVATRSQPQCPTSSRS